MTLRIEIHESFPPTIVGEDTSFNLHALRFYFVFLLHWEIKLLTYLLNSDNKGSIHKP